MNCAATREELLGCERPDKPGPELSRHLIGCAACQGWLRRLVRLERRLPLLWVEVPPVPAGLLEALDGPVVRPFVPAAGTRREGARRKAALASSLAAALLLFAIGWGAWPHLHEDGLVAAYQARRDARLAGVAKPQRAGALVELAGEFVSDARGAVPEQAERMAACLEQLLRVDLPAQVEAVTPGEREATLGPLLERLGRVESEAARLAAASRGSGRLTAAYERMAGSARQADRRLRAMMRA